MMAPRERWIIVDAFPILSKAKKISLGVSNVPKNDQKIGLKG